MFDTSCITRSLKQGAWLLSQTKLQRNMITKKQYNSDFYINITTTDGKLVSNMINYKNSTSISIFTNKKHSGIKTFYNNAIIYNKPLGICHAMELTCQF